MDDPRDRQSVTVTSNVHPTGGFGTIMPKTLATAKFTELPDSPGQYRATLTGLPSGQIELALRGPDIDRLLADVTNEKQKSLQTLFLAGMTRYFTKNIMMIPAP